MTLLQKHVIDKYNTLLCHPGMNWTEETMSQHSGCTKMRKQITAMCKNVRNCQMKMDTYYPKKQKLIDGRRYVLT